MEGRAWRDNIECKSLHNYDINERIDRISATTNKQTLANTAVAKVTAIP